jgi:hypothetical protein
MKRWKSSVALVGLATGLLFSTSNKCRVATLSFLFGAICLCLVPGLWAQSVKDPAPASGSNNQPGLTAVNTGCGYSTGKAPAAAIRPQHRPGQNEDRSGQPLLVLISGHGDPSSDSDSDIAEIVGLWKFEFTATSPFLGPFDAGYVTWHSDGTELMNSSRAPTTGSFCMGAWKQIGHSTYKLNHFALAWAFDADAPDTGPGTGGAIFVGPANIREQVTVDRSGNNYEGTFTLVQYAPDGITVLATITGTVTATRITAD